MERTSSALPILVSRAEHWSRTCSNFFLRWSRFAKKSAKFVRSMPISWTSEAIRLSSRACSCSPTSCCLNSPTSFSLRRSSSTARFRLVSLYSRSVLSGSAELLDNDGMFIHQPTTVTLGFTSFELGFDLQLLQLANPFTLLLQLFPHFSAFLRHLAGPFLGALQLRLRHGKIASCPAEYEFKFV